jgi:glycosyltransferase involved in cell wall biosynthesis
VRVHVVDPPAYTPPYDRALCATLARAGADVELWTSRFDYAPPPTSEGFGVVEAFYRRAPGAPGSRRRRAARLAQHVPDLLRYRRAAAAADVVHFQWLPVQTIDWALLPPRRPRLLTAHDVLPREARPAQRAGQRALYARMDAVIVHSEHGAARLRDEVGVDAEKVHVIPHGAFHELAAVEPAPLPAEVGGPGLAPSGGRDRAPTSGPDRAPTRGPIALCFGLMRPYKGLDVLVEAWRRAALPPGAELWIAGRPRMDVEPLRAVSPPGVRWITRFVSDAELAALFRAADLAVLPYREIDQSGVLYTALAFGTPLLLTAVGGFPEVARTGAGELVAPGDPDALAQALGALLGDPARRAALAEAAEKAGAPDGPYGWDAIGRRTLALYVALQANTM